MFALRFLCALPSLLSFLELRRFFRNLRNRAGVNGLLDRGSIRDLSEISGRGGGWKMGEGHNFLSP